MTLETVIVLAVYVLAVARLTRLVNYDTILDPLRVAAAKVFGVDSTVIYFLGCPWCVGFWLSLVLSPVPVAVLGLPWWWLPLLALACSHLVGLAAPLSADDDMEIEVVERG